MERPVKRNPRAILCGPRVLTEGDLAVVAKFERILECQDCRQPGKCAINGCAQIELVCKFPEPCNCGGTCSYPSAQTREEKWTMITPRQVVLAVPCPRCGARKGERCFSGDDRTRRVSKPHIHRIWDAEQRQGGE